MLREVRVTGEDIPQYIRRRGRAARKLCKERGLWSQRWYTRAIKWDRHLARSKNQISWSSRLRSFHSGQWLIDQRASFIASASSSSSILAGRTGTRSFQGKVFMRWHDGVTHALASVSQQQC